LLLKKSIKMLNKIPNIQGYGEKLAVYLKSPLKDQELETKPGP